MTEKNDELYSHNLTVNTKFIVKATSTTLLILLMSGCGTFRRISYPWEYTFQPVSSKDTGFKAAQPHSFTIYPFKNISWYENAAKRGRMATYKAFSLIGRCAPLQETDRLTSTPYTFDNAIRVARKQKSDALVIGEVVEEENSFLFLYAYNYVEMDLTIYDTATGAPLWHSKGWGFSHAFGGLVFWIPNPILPAIENIFWSRITMDLYNRITMDAVHQLRPDLVNFETKETGQ